MCMTINISIRLSMVFICGVLLLSCDRSSKKRGHDFIPDMSYSRAYETNSTNTVFADSMSMRSPVHGTVPRDFIPFRYTIEPESRILAGKELINPFNPDPDVLERGKYIFTTFCIGCHGSTGAGDGHLFASGLFPLKPRAIAEEPTAKLKDGEIFHTITLGFGSMGSHASQIKPDDRWKTVLYVRELQKAMHMHKKSK